MLWIKICAANEAENDVENDEEKLNSILWEWIF